MAAHALEHRQHDIGADAVLRDHALEQSILGDERDAGGDRVPRRANVRFDPFDSDLS